MAPLVAPPVPKNCPTQLVALVLVQLMSALPPKLIN